MARSSEKIRNLNDRFRLGDAAVPGHFLMTVGVQALINDEQHSAADALLERIRLFDAFDDDNDPHREHDFGTFEIGGRKLFWKIDYYDPELLNGSADPADPTKTCRVLTVMLAEEY